MASTDKPFGHHYLSKGKGPNGRGREQGDMGKCVEKGTASDFNGCCN